METAGKKRQRGSDDDDGRMILLTRARSMAGCCALLMQKFLPEEFPHTGGNKFHIGSELTEVVRQLDLDRQDVKAYYDGLYMFEQHKFPKWVDDILSSAELDKENMSTEDTIKKFFKDLDQVTDMLLLQEEGFLSSFCLDRLRELAYTMLHHFQTGDHKTQFDEGYRGWSNMFRQKIKDAHKQARYLRPLKYGSWFSHAE